jgi:hypothetical protein
VWRAPGVGSPNAAAEWALRPAVIWRQQWFGIPGAGGHDRATGTNPLPIP